MLKTSKRKRRRKAAPTDPRAAARAAALRYVDDHETGIRRRRAGRGFTYFGPDGKPIRDPETLDRIRALAIPPAYTDVWICIDPDGHIQATGRDARGRKQYRYHPRWVEIRDQGKFERMLAFAEALPRIRDRVEADLSLSGLPRERVLAVVVRLLETTFIRVGNAEYARNNDSYGLTTLRDEHVSIEGSKLRFFFRGKSGIEHEIDLKDRRLARLVRRSQDLPGQSLFQYLDEAGERHSITSTDVNSYLREISGDDFTAKDFRTWGGTLLALLALAEAPPFESETAFKKAVTAVMKSVAAQLGNTVTVCRKYYVHPTVVEAYHEGTLVPLLERLRAELPEDAGALRLEETALVALIEGQTTSTPRRG